MVEYINRETVINHLDDCMDTLWKPEIIALKCFVEGIPAADVPPMMHSYWEEYSCSQYMGTDEFGEPKWRDGRFYVCHNYRCRRKTVVKSNYCPNCGSRMDGAE